MALCYVWAASTIADKAVDYMTNGLNPALGAKTILGTGAALTGYPEQSQAVMEGVGVNVNLMAFLTGFFEIAANMRF